MHWNLLPGMYLWQNTSLGKKGFNFLRNSKLQFFNAGVSILLCSDLYSSATQPSHLVRQIKVFFKKNGPFPSSFSFIFGLLSKHHNTIFSTNQFGKMSIQYTVLGFELTTFRQQVSSHNHQTGLRPKHVKVSLQQKQSKAGPDLKYCLSNFWPFQVHPETNQTGNHLSIISCGKDLLCPDL